MKKRGEQYQSYVNEDIANANFKKTFGHPKGTISKKL
jgi:hypothetical protein